MKKYIVIGAGILGTSVAYHLAKAGAQVTIIDRHDNGQATDAAAGIVCPWLTQRRNKPWYRLVKGGAKFYPTLIKELEDIGEKNTGYEKVGAISLHTEEAKLDKLEERAHKRREDAPEIGEITRLSPSETKALFPPLADHYGSVHISGGARVNGRALRDALMNAATKLGATFIKSDAKLLNNKDETIGIQIAEKKIEADQIIVTGGAWANEVFTDFKKDFLVTPQKAQIVHLKIEGIDTSKWPVVMPPNNQYLLTFEDGRVVIGATHEDDVGFDHRVTPGGIHEIFEKALAVAPGLATSTFVETRVGFRPFTPRFLPIFGEVPHMKGLFVANGLGASGLTSGPYLGAEVAKLVLGEPLTLNQADYDVLEAFK